MRKNFENAGALYDMWGILSCVGIFWQIADREWARSLKVFPRMQCKNLWIMTGQVMSGS